jgi:hypothetical protein
MMAQESPVSRTNEANLNHHRENCDEAEIAGAQNRDCRAELSVGSTNY